ncbi:MAG: hypothetical protein EB078_04915 [Proteobacteria bacterium]|nr:hypothetical protein [Pseudomonadota bacterium]NDC23640.1 hypothetical protein [Pseudomonadota bacterium]NDD04225.1 hypothetical protein [Pseudomonadota bacterium]NDG25905.1 hypothetical protein [Pseudomonadota bacterium]
MHLQSIKGMEVSFIGRVYKKKVLVPFTEKVSLGRQCESLAAEYLLKRKWRLVARNVRLRLGEIDLIVEDPESGQRWLVEVRGRRQGIRKASVWLSRAKIKRLKKLAEIMRLRTQRVHRILFLEVEMLETSSGSVRIKEFEIDGEA